MRGCIVIGGFGKAMPAPFSGGHLRCMPAHCLPKNTPSPDSSPAAPPCAPALQLLPSHPEPHLLGRRARAAGAEPDAARAHQSLHLGSGGGQVGGPWLAARMQAAAGAALWQLDWRLAWDACMLCCQTPCRTTFLLWWLCVLGVLPPRSCLQVWRGRVCGHPAVRRAVRQDQGRQAAQGGAPAVQRLKPLRPPAQVESRRRQCGRQPAAPCGQVQQQCGGLAATAR